MSDERPIGKPQVGETRVERANTFRREMRLPELKFEDDEHGKAPPVNLDLVQALADGQITGPAASDLYQMVERFRTWNEAFSAVLRQRKVDPTA